MKYMRGVNILNLITTAVTSLGLLLVYNTYIFIMYMYVLLHNSTLQCEERRLVGHIKQQARILDFLWGAGKNVKI